MTHHDVGERDIAVDQAERPAIRAASAVRVIENAANAGFTRGVNQGLDLARGEVMFVLNPDCTLGPGALVRLLESLAADATLAAVAPALADTHGRVARSCGRFPSLWSLFADHFGLASASPGSPWLGGYKYGGRPMESLGRVDWASGAALLINRAAYEDLGGFDEHLFMYMEEVDWCRRAALAGLGVRYVPAAAVVHVGQQSSRRVPGQTYLHNLRSRVYYFRKHHGPVAALAAKGILASSLVLKWLGSRVSPARREDSAVYAAGLEALREVAWR